MSAQVRKPHNKRWKLWKAQGGECPLCLRSIRWNAQIADEQPTLDHIIPKKIGGGNEITNLRVVHALCNARRGHSLTAMPWADTPAVIAAAFLSEPVAPPGHRDHVGLRESPGVAGSRDQCRTRKPEKATR